ncbi:MAG: hypothetical protein LBK52_07980, partial [Deltaproteobacteria bacterium]|nr:hypothetical protein [Deltaproteobacteria bacterium]
ANPPNCYEFGYYISRCEDRSGRNPSQILPGSSGHPASLHNLDTVFDVGRWLAYLDGGKLVSGSRSYRTPAVLSTGQRRIYYGRPEAGSAAMKLFDTQNSLADLTNLILPRNYADILPVPAGLSKAQAASRLINYILGEDQPGWRSRTVGDPWGDNQTPVVWRLGDIINSKPIIVGPPSFNYDLLYGDASYSDFRVRQAQRRQMLYFGANDGLLHALNMGFFGSLYEGQVFYQTNPGGGKPAHDLGAEVWAYLPASLLPHLSWLADPQYKHSYYVDLKPLVSDLVIDGQWRTVVIGGLRLGGRPIEAPAKGSPGGDHYFSEIFALDVTDPESEPRLLWRYSSLEMGLPAGLPMAVRSGGRWYVIIASGPVTDTPAYDPQTGEPAVKYGDKSPYAGYSNQKARLIVLDAATGREVTHLTAEEDFSFFNEPFLPVAQTRTADWSNHAVYYGLTVSRQEPQCLDGGAVYRLQMAAADGRPLPVQQWQLKRLLKTDRPVTGAVNSTFDGNGNLWVLFGTGRLWSEEDLNPCSRAPAESCRENHQQYLFGIKEELGPGRLMTFKDRTSEAGRILDVSGARVQASGLVTGVKAQGGLLATSPGGATSFQAIAEAAMGNGTIGYKRRLDAGSLLKPSQDHLYEMMLTQPKLAAASNGESLAAFTTYEPSTAVCGEMGRGYLYLLHTFTGLPLAKTSPSFGGGQYDPASGEDPVLTGVVETGDGRPTEAIVLPVEGSMIIRSSGADGTITEMELPPDLVLTSRLTSWKEVQDIGYEMSPEVLTKDLPE